MSVSRAELAKRMEISIPKGAIMSSHLWHFAQLSHKISIPKGAIMRSELRC